MNASDTSASVQGQHSRLEQADLIRLAAAVPDLEYLFRHALIPDSVYQTLVRADRRRVHRAAGEALEALWAGREPPAELAPPLARHFEEAADYPRAVHYYTLAGEAALAGYANAEAVAAFSRALAAADRSAPACASWVFRPTCPRRRPGWPRPSCSRAGCRRPKRNWARPRPRRWARLWPSGR